MLLFLSLAPVERSRGSSSIEEPSYVMARHVVAAALVCKRGLLFLAELAFLIAAGLETAARRRVYRTWNIPLQKDPLPLRLRRWDRDGRDQRAGVWVQGVGKELVLGTELHDFPQVHHTDVVADMLDYA